MTAATLTRPAAQTSSSKSAKTKSTAPRLPRPKPVYKPRITPVDRVRGVYDVQSQTCDLVIYRVDLAAGSCECPAYEHGIECKHRKIAAYMHPWFTGEAQPAPAPVAVPAPVVRVSHTIGSWGSSTEMCDACGQQIVKHETICVMVEVDSGRHVGGYCAECARKAKVVAAEAARQARSQAVAVGA